MLTAIALTNKSRNLNRTVRSTVLLAKRGKGWKWGKLGREAGI